ncbi:hypothetical protein GCM10025771_24530 [Niveibacterium umoris]|uniref:Polar amino acid transport system substrate-binding protein n=1 Tax=Niveibacterium umoris TaxID=1193620 RepID=A0A840BLC4_9RHOO|nr:transporter substrate-binding domain-containing protein [Niveibacterium umoris]MBB4012358.1 polar amino acid transport system substrate-binding protein [Niveibacterium umoris]
MARCGAAVLLLWATLIASSCLAAPLADCTRPLTVGFYAIAPYYYALEDKPGWHGIDRDLIDELALRTGCRFEARFESRVRIWQQIETGTLDLTVSGIETAERQRFATFIAYASERAVLAARADRAPAPRSPAAVLGDKTLTLAVTRGYRYGPPFDTWIDSLRASDRVFESADEDSALRLVALGRVDATILRDSAWAIATRAYPAGSLRLVDMGAPSLNAALVLSRAVIGPALEEKIRAAIAEMLRDGTLLRMLERHMPPDIARRSLPREAPR